MNFSINGDFIRDRQACRCFKILKNGLCLNKLVVFLMHIMDTQHNNINNVTFFVYYAKIVVRVLTHGPRAEGEWTMRQNPNYYFGIVHAKCNIIIIIMLSVHNAH